MQAFIGSASPFLSNTGGIHKRRFDEGNRMFVELISRREPAKRHRCLFVLDEGALAARPRLSEEIAAYAAAHADRLELIARPMGFAGGEESKLGHSTVQGIGELLLSHRVDRHSFLCALGASSDSKASNLQRAGRSPTIAPERAVRASEGNRGVCNWRPQVL